MQKLLFLFFCFFLWGGEEENVQIGLHIKHKKCMETSQLVIDRKGIGFKAQHQISLIRQDRYTEEDTLLDANK